MGLGSKAVFIGVFFLLVSSQSFGTLGELIKSGGSPGTGTARVTGLAKFSVHETVENGVTVKEYVSPEGVVFAVSWRGVAPPDLSTLLGSFYPEYETAVRNTPRKRSRAPVSEKTSRMVVRRGGHMRDIRGLAIAEEFLPSGVNPEDLP